jgi:hypothetical protein
MALSDTSKSLRPPRSIEQITRDAQNYEYSANVGIKYWLRSAAALLKEVRHYNYMRRKLT